MLAEKRNTAIFYSLQPSMDLTNIFIIKDDQVLLAMKKRRYGAGKWNGYGGKLDEGETLLQAAVRELMEESTLEIQEEDLEKVGELTYIEQADDDLKVHVYLLRDISGEPVETEEMAPQWFQIDDLPLDTMWDGDKHWLPRILAGEKLVGTLRFEGEECQEVDLRPWE